jgi:predicted negative regulator of RcsB-dependent stress response
MRKIFFFVVLLMYFFVHLYGFIFEQQESGYVLENIFSFPQQTKYLGLGYVNNSLLDINSASLLNPALIYKVFYKELNLSYSPLVLGSNFFCSSFTTAIKTKNFYFPLSISVGNITSGEAEKFNILKESYGYNFRETLTFTNFAISHYFKDYDINLGLNFKTFFQSIDDYYASSAGLDLGVVFPLKSKEYLWGISILNFLPTKFGSEKLVPIIRTSLNHRVGKIFFSEVKIYTEFDVVNFYNINEVSTRWGVGTSYDFFYLPISLCFSLSYYQAGIGIDIEKDNFNFSYGFYYNLIGPQHKFALGYKFDFYPEEVKKVVFEEKKVVDETKKEFLEEYKAKKEELKKLKEEYKIQQQVALKLSLAKDYIEQKNYSQAKIVLQEALKISPDNQEVKDMLYLVNTYLNRNTISQLYAEAKKEYEKGNYDLAIEKLNKLLELDSENKSAFVLLKLCNAQKNILQRKYKEAKTELFEIIKIEPDNSQAMELLKKVDTLIEVGE